MCYWGSPLCFFPQGDVPCLCWVYPHTYQVLIQTMNSRGRDGFDFYNPCSAVGLVEDFKMDPKVLFCKYLTDLC